MRTFIAILIALSSPLLFPVPFTIVLVILASVLVPPVGIVAGVLTDALYYTAAVHIPYATLVGLLISVIGYLVHQFIKTRIMSA